MILYKAVMEDETGELTEHYIQAKNAQEANKVAEKLAEQLGYDVSFVEIAANILVNYIDIFGNLKCKRIAQTYRI